MAEKDLMAGCLKPPRLVMAGASTYMLLSPPSYTIIEC
jgi:hypothetical protein